MKKFTVRQLRLMNEKTMQEVADYLGIHVNTYYWREHGERPFYFNDIYKLAKLYKVDIDEIELPEINKD